MSNDYMSFLNEIDNGMKEMVEKGELLDVQRVQLLKGFEEVLIKDAIGEDI